MIMYTYVLNCIAEERWQ